MKLRRVLFDRYVGNEQTRLFTSDDYDIELDAPRVGLITITPLRPGLKLTERTIVAVNNLDMVPMEAPVEPPAARPLPARSRAK